jgi:hypothetical protein
MDYHPLIKRRYLTPTSPKSTALINRLSSPPLLLERIEKPSLQTLKCRISAESQEILPYKRTRVYSLSPRDCPDFSMMPTSPMVNAHTTLNGIGSDNRTYLGFASTMGEPLLTRPTVAHESASSLNSMTKTYLAANSLCILPPLPLKESPCHNGDPSR